MNDTLVSVDPAPPSGDGYVWVLTDRRLTVLAGGKQGPRDGPLFAGGGAIIRAGVLEAEFPGEAGLVAAAARALAGEPAVFRLRRAPPRGDLFGSVRAEQDGLTLRVGFVDPEEPLPLQRAHLENWFGLTPAEAAIALDLSAGLEVKPIARARGLSPYTVRTHMRALFRKVGVNRQADLVRLLTQLSRLA